MGDYKSDKKNTRIYHMKLSRNTDADIIQQLDKQENKQAYLKALIRADIEKGEKKNDDNR